MAKLENTNEYSLVLDIIFNVASSNRFYSEVYAKIYKELLDKSSDMFRERLQKEVVTYIERFSSIQNVNPNEDYEAFCEVNKENEHRKAMTEFFVNLMKMKVISGDEMLNIYHNLCDIVLVLVEDAENKHTVVELSENIFIMMEKGASFFSENKVFTEMVDRLKPVTKMKVKDHPGLSNKSLFKFMDVMDIKV